MKYYFTVIKLPTNSMVIISSDRRLCWNAPWCSSINAIIVLESNLVTDTKRPKNSCSLPFTPSSYYSGLA